ncbi:MAG: PilX N-terminal domain-containing pilus assembly protein [Xanthomonadales bacterium]|nr:PilX N-terminal domain-containing pilus assembly protein [Xanthomonadales bacterium]
MYNSRGFRFMQRGVALLLSLLILLVLTLLGVSAFHNSHIQERSAGNMRLQSVVFEAAAAGAANAINFYDANKTLSPDEDCGKLGHTGWENATDWVTVGNFGEATLKQRMYCLADLYPEGDVRPARSQLFVLSRGEITSGGSVVAQRDIEIRLDIGATGGGAGNGCGAICFPSCNPGTFNFPNSNSFIVDGNGGPAITGGCSSMHQALQTAIRHNRIGNYYGGIAESTINPPWDSPDSTETFREHVMNAALAAQAAGSCQTYCYRGSSAYEFGNPAFGTEAAPQITYIAGNAFMGGDVTGAGILFVNGNLAWNGTPQFKGLIVTLGGTFTIDGGGLGGDHGGSVVVLNQAADPSDPNAEFEPSNLSNTGGGTALYKFDCSALWMAHGLLDGTGQGLWTPDCDVAPAGPYDAGPGELVIASWRENIGWREDFFGSD